MVDLVRQRIEAQHLSSRITAQQADAQDLHDFAVRRRPQTGQSCRSSVDWMLQHQPERCCLQPCCYTLQVSLR